MNIWRVKSKTGSTVHLTSDREKTFCGRTIKDDWKFIFLLNDRTEALEHVEDLCERCNTTNLEEWEKEFEADEDDNGWEITESEEREDSSTTIVSRLEQVDKPEEVEPVKGFRV